MKKYWKIIAIVIVIVLSVGTFYIQSALATKPQLVIKSLVGDKSEIESLVIHGGYMNGNIHDQFLIQSNGMEYRSDLPLSERISGYFLPRDIKELQEKYRNFMRGKYPDGTLFFEDDNYLTYADIPYDSSGHNLKYEISILNKKTNEETTFNDAIPNRSNYLHADVRAVHMLDDELKVLTQNDLQSADEGVEVHLYTFDIPTKELIEDEIIGSYAQEIDRGRHEGISLISNGDAKSKEIVLSKFITKSSGNEQENFSEEFVEQELLIYDLESSNLKTMDLPEEINEFGNLTTFIDSNLYMTDVDKDGIKVTTYNVVNKEVETILNIQNPQMIVEDKNDLYTLVKDGKLYVIAPYMDFTSGTPIVIADLETKEILYEGEIVSEDPVISSDNHYFDFYDLELAK